MQVLQEQKPAIQRGNNREAIFYAEADYQFYLEKLKLVCEKHGCDLHAYIELNPAHVVMVVHPSGHLWSSYGA